MKCWWFMYLRGQSWRQNKGKMQFRDGGGGRERDQPIEDESYRDAVAAAARRGVGGLAALQFSSHNIKWYQGLKLLGTYTSTVMAGCTRCTRSRFFSKFVNASTALAKQYLEQGHLK
jgi:hypothetical protein